MCKMVYERFKKIVAEHSLADRCNDYAWSVEGERDERVVLLDGIVQQHADFVVAKRTKHSDRTDADKGFQGAVERIRLPARHRVLRDG